MMSNRFALLTVSLLPTLVLSLNNGVAKLPVMGYNAWNAFQCNVDEALVLQTAQQMVKLGLHDAGYTQFNLDDCWSLKNRSSTGQLVADPAKFPSGMKNLTSSLKKLGFTAGIYGDSGWFTCAGFPGSFQHEAQDVQTWMDWGFNYIKLDNCAIPFDDVIQQGIVGKYERMADAVAKVASQKKSQPMIFSLCEWGWSQVWLWGKQFGQSWRTTGDIAAQWNSLAAIINFNSFLTANTDFFGRNDMDMLQLGNPGLSFDEAKSHWTAWALMKSPLLVGTNLSAITSDMVSILTNKEIIAINQDPVVGTSISPFRWGKNPDWTSDPNFPAQFWSGPVQNDGVVFMVLNTLDEPSTLSFNLTESPWIRAGRQYSVRDLWTHTNNGTAVRTFTTTLPAHGVAALLMHDAGPEPKGLFPDCMAWWQCTAQNGTRTGG